MVRGCSSFAAESADQHPLDRLRGESWLPVFPESAALADTATASRLNP
jgi:hypothetical protein